MTAQGPAPPILPTAVPALVDEIVTYQLENFHHDAWGLQYRVHRVDNKEDSVRELIESSDGNVARTLLRQNQPLSADQEAAEKARLRSLSPSEMQKHRRGQLATDKFGMDLIRVMPRAMIYTLVPDQPQLPRVATTQIVLDYSPNPLFHPESEAQSLLPGLAGRIWIDAETHHLLRIQINITRNLNLALGILARVYQGGSITYEQVPVGGGHDGYQHVEINVRLRELMVRTVPYHLTLDASDIKILQPMPTLRQAVDALLAIPSPNEKESQR